MLPFGCINLHNNACFYFGEIGLMFKMSEKQKCDLIVGLRCSLKEVMSYRPTDCKGEFRAGWRAMRNEMKNVRSTYYSMSQLSSIKQFWIKMPQRSQKFDNSMAPLPPRPQSRRSSLGSSLVTLCCGMVLLFVSLCSINVADWFSGVISFFLQFFSVHEANTQRKEFFTNLQQLSGCVC